MAGRRKRGQKAREAERWRLTRAAVYDTPRGRAVPIVLVEQPDPTGTRWATALDLLLEAGRHAAAREA
jgi:hypothetical protein